MGAVGLSLTAAARLASRSGYGVVVRPAVFGVLRGSPPQLILSSVEEQSEQHPCARHELPADSCGRFTIR